MLSNKTGQIPPDNFQSFLHRIYARFSGRANSCLRIIPRSFLFVVRWCRGSVIAHPGYYLVATVFSYAALCGLQRTTVIAPFQIPPDSTTRTSLPFSGEIVADV